MPFLSFLIGPIVGGVIGGLTNKLAIHMLFRPYKAYYIGRWRIPLTPGIIPKEKERIAQSIGQTVSQELLNPEVLSASLLSAEMESKVGDAVDKFVYDLMHNDQSLQQVLSSYIAAESIASTTHHIKDNLTEAIYAKLADEQVGATVAHMAIDHMANNADGALMRVIGPMIMPLLRDSLERKLAKIINGMLANNGRSMVGHMIDTEVDSIMGRPVSQLCQGKEQLLAQLRDALVRAYRQAVTHNLDKILAALNLQQVIEDRINALDMKATEEMIVGIMDKELKALVWLGVFLGFILGFLSNL